MNVKDATHATVHDYPGGAESLAPLTDSKAQVHIIDPQDEHHHDHADAHVFMMNGLLVAKDVVMPLEQGSN